MIDQRTIQKLKEIDIVEGISNHIELKKTGSSYVACCPFHDETTPSFSVYSKRQKFNCFGCGESGDLIDFVIKYSNVSFRAACKQLSETYGIRLESEDREGYVPKAIRDELWHERVIIKMSEGMTHINESDKKRILIAKNRLREAGNRYNLNET